MTSVELNINGRFYTIACDPGEEDRVRQLSRVVDEKARSLGSAASDAQRFLMVCLMLADELDEAQASAPAGKKGVSAAEDHDLLVAAVDHLAERIDHIAAALAQA
jgi:cell division protein ZapA